MDERIINLLVFVATMLAVSGLSYRLGLHPRSAEEGQGHDQPDHRQHVLARLFCGPKSNVYRCGRVTAPVCPIADVRPNRHPSRATAIPSRSCWNGITESCVTPPLESAAGRQDAGQRSKSST